VEAEALFRAMGADCHVLVVGGDALVATARRRIDDLEQRWSRFLPKSEISRLNALEGRPVVVSPDTYLLVSLAVAAWEATGGLFDPTVMNAVAAMGYDRSFEHMAVREMTPAPEPKTPPGCGAIDLEPALCAITLPGGLAIDPGGIGKGLAADLVAAELMDAEAGGVLVNVGGDIRVAGESPVGDVWSIRVDHPLDPDRELVRLGLGKGAVATSSRLKRRWWRGGDEVHHLIDPRCGRSTESEVVAATVVSGEAWWAEVQTKPIFILGPEPGLKRLISSSGMAVTDAGRVISTPDLESP
jgi:thiamine biosynthesis lipoprotein